MGWNLESGYGNLTAAYMYQTVAALEQTGDTMLGVYDFENQIVYLAYPDYKSNTPAYVRPMVELNMTNLFAMIDAIES